VSYYIKMSSQFPEVGSKRVDYMDKKLKSYSAKSSRQIIPSSNGNSFQLNSVINIDLQGNQPNTYLDFAASYVRFTVTNSDAVAIEIGSAYDLIDRVEVLVDGSTVSNINNYNALVAQLMDESVGGQFREHLGKCLMGTCNASVESNAVSIAAGASKTFCLPLICTPLFNSSKYIPCFSRSSIRLRITLANAVRGVVSASTTTPTLDSEVVLSPVDFVGQYIRVSQDAQMQIDANCNGFYELVVSDFRSAEGTYNANDTNLNLNLGISVSSLDRLMFGFYSTRQTADAFSNQNRSNLLLQDYAISVNGLETPRRRIESSTTNFAEPCAELAVASTNSLGDFNHQSMLNPASFILTGGAGKAKATVGTALYMIDLESLKPHGGDGDAIYSGISTIGATTQLVGTFSAGTNTQHSILVYGQYTMSLVLDMKSSQTFMVQT